MKSLTIIFLIVLSSVFARAQEEEIDSLKQELAIAKEDTNKVNLLNALVFSYAWSYADTGLLYAQQALGLAEKLNYEQGIIESQRRMTWPLTTLGNYPLALEYAFKALSLSQKLRNNEMMGLVTTTIALCYRESGDYENGLSYYYKALQLAEKYQSKFDIAILWDDISTTYVKKNQPDSAIFYAKKSYEVISYWPGQPVNIGDAYLEKGRYDSAMHWYRIGLDLALQNHTDKVFIDVGNNIALIQMHKGNMDSAAWYAKKALSEKMGNVYPSGLLKAANILTDIYESKNKADSTLKYLKVADSLKESLFGREKTIAIQNLVFKEQQNQEELRATKLKYQNRLRIYVLLGGLLALLLIAGILLRSNRHKQRDKTKIEKAFTELKSTQSQLIQSEKMASLGELTAGIAHEIQNPLNFVNNFSEVSNELMDEMKEELKKGNYADANEIADDVKQNLERINHHGKRADAIVKGMLQHSRRSSGVKEPTDINALCDEYLRLSYHGLRAKDKSFNATMKTDFDESLEKINIVPQDIGRVILNLLTNAFYAVSERLRQAQPDTHYEPTVTISTKKLNGKIEIVVKDNGNGIPQKVLDKIFQPFFTTKPTGQGTGLGLSLSYDIIKAHSGEIKVETKETVGTQFIIYLPSKG